MMKFRLLAAMVFLGLSLQGPLAFAQAGEQGPPLRDGLPEREPGKKARQRREQKLREELESHYRKWLKEDVRYIISPEEKEALLHLNTEEEREQFIEQFWLRRDPTPNTIENEFKEEHYRRIAFANERFTSGKPGWRTDRGRMYILYGPPDEMETYPGGGSYLRTPEEGGGGTAVYPFERWRYRRLEDIGEDVVLEFIDPTMSGEYRLAMDSSEKDALLHVPSIGLSKLESMGLSSKSHRFTRSDGTNIPASRFESPHSDQFERIRLLAAIHKPPPVKFKDLEALVETRISFNLLPFAVRQDFIRITDAVTLVPLTLSLQRRDLTFEMSNGIQQAVVNVFGRVTTLAGRIVETFEDVIRLQVPPSLFADTLEQAAVYPKTLTLRPGLYKLQLVLKDLHSGNVGTLEQRLPVPGFEAGELAHSSLILADQLERVASRQVESGPFVVGDLKVRPAVGGRFGRHDRLGIYLQVYNLGISDQTHLPEARIRYQLRQANQTIFEHVETTSELAHAGQQITLQKILPLKDFQPGEYEMRVVVTDLVAQQTISPSTRFQIVPD